jgi:hypothetical protein
MDMESFPERPVGKTVEEAPGATADAVRPHPAPLVMMPDLQLETPTQPEMKLADPGKPDLETAEAAPPDLETAEVKKPGAAAELARPHSPPPVMMPDLQLETPSQPAMKLAAPGTPDLEMAEPAKPDSKAVAAKIPDLEITAPPMTSSGPVTALKAPSIPDLEMGSAPAIAPKPVVTIKPPVIPDIEMGGPSMPDLEHTAAPKPDLEMAPAAPSPPSAAGLSESGQFPLEFGDFAHRIPTHLLRDAPGDAKIPLPIDVAEIAECVASGKTTLLLSEIRRRLPAVFHGGIPAGEDLPILYPWQKIGRLIKETATEGANENNLLQELVKATAAARASRAIPPPPPSIPPAPSSAPTPDLAQPETEGAVEPALESRLAAMRESQARQLARIQTEREALLSRLTADAGRARDEMRKDYEERLTKAALARDQAQATVAKLEAEKIKIMAEAQAVADREVSDTIPGLEERVKQLEAKLASAQEEHSAMLASKETMLEWNTRSIADLEEEVKTYRDRIKTVLAERDSLTREKAELATQLEQATNAAAAAAAAQVPASTPAPEANIASDALREKITKIMAANGEFIRVLGTLSTANEELMRVLEEQKNER